MREPLSRALSHYAHCQRAHPGCLGNTSSFQEFSQAELQPGTSLQCVMGAVNSMHIIPAAELARRAAREARVPHRLPLGK